MTFPRSDPDLNIWSNLFNVSNFNHQDAAKQRDTHVNLTRTDYIEAIMTLVCRAAELQSCFPSRVQNSDVFRLVNLYGIIKSKDNHRSKFGHVLLNRYFCGKSENDTVCGCSYRSSTPNCKFRKIILNVCATVSRWNGWVLAFLGG